MMCLHADKAQALHLILLRSLLMSALPCCAAPSFEKAFVMHLDVLPVCWRSTGTYY